MSNTQRPWGGGTESVERSDHSVVEPPHGRYIRSSLPSFPLLGVLLKIFLRRFSISSESSNGSKLWYRSLSSFQAAANINELDQITRFNAQNRTPTTVSDSQYLSLITKKADDFSFDFQIREFFQIS